MQLDATSALITGGASGLGAATARRLTRAGVRVVVLDRDADGVAKMRADGIDGLVGDVTSEDDMADAIAAAAERGPLRTAVACAGIGDPMRTVSGKGMPAALDRFRWVLEVNVTGTFNLVRLAGAEMARLPPLDGGERGVIVQTASCAAFDGQIGQAAYSASKAGIVGMTLPLARDLGRHGIRVNTIAPGTFDTPLWNQAPPEAQLRTYDAAAFPRRAGDPDDFAMLVEHLAANSYINAETIRLDAGLRMASS